MQILLVDDDRMQRRIVAVQLRGAGFQNIVEASDVVSALASLDHHAIDLVVSDIVMPGATGIDLLETIEEHWPLIPVVLLTGLPTAATAGGAVRGHAFDFLTKPVRPAALIAAVQRASVERRMRLASAESERRQAVHTAALERRVVARTQALTGALAALDHHERRLVRAERLAAVGSVAAGVAHEIRNPISFVAMNLEHLADLAAHNELDGEEVGTIVHETLLGVRRVQAIVSDLTDACRSQASVAVPIEVNGVIREAVKLAEGNLHGVLITTGSDEPAWVLGAPDRLVQVIVNLLNNAAHALGRTPNPEIVIAIERVEGLVLIGIADNGSGMDTSTADRAREPFFTTKGDGDGMGLGLYLCEQYTSAMGGRLEIESEAGLGTTAIIELPAAADFDGVEPPEERLTTDRIRVLARSFGSEEST